MSTIALKSRKRRQWPKFPKPPFIFYLCLALFIISFLIVSKSPDSAEDLAISLLFNTKFIAFTGLNIIFWTGIYVLFSYSDQRLFLRWEVIYLPIAASSMLGEYLGQMVLFHHADEISLLIAIIKTLIEKFGGDVLLRLLPNYTPPE
jgi:hypothetical protein